MLKMSGVVKWVDLRLWGRCLISEEHVHTANIIFINIILMADKHSIQAVQQTLMKRQDKSSTENIEKVGLKPYI